MSALIVVGGVILGVSILEFILLVFFMIYKTTTLYKRIKAEGRLIKMPPLVAGYPPVMPQQNTAHPAPAPGFILPPSNAPSTHHVSMPPAYSDVVPPSQQGNQK